MTNQVTTYNFSTIAKVLIAQHGVPITVLINGQEEEVVYCAEQLGFVTQGQSLLCRYLDKQLIAESIIAPRDSHRPSFNYQYDSGGCALSLRFNDMQLRVESAGFSVLDKHNLGLMLAKGELSLQGDDVKVNSNTGIHCNTLMKTQKVWGQL